MGALYGLLALGIYLAVLARADIASVLSRRAPWLAGGWVVVPLALVAAGVVLAAVTWARMADRRASLDAALFWVRTHAVPLGVAGITLAALAVRVFGISDNLPYISHPDEPAVADRALAIIQTGDYNPHYFVYPHLFYYMLAGVDAVRFFSLVSSGQATDLPGLVPTDFYLWNRLLTALLGALCVPLVYAAGRRLYSAAVGLVAGAFIAANSVHIVHSQLVVTDVPSAFFSALALFAIARLVPAFPRTGPPARGLPPLSAYLFAGVAMGLAVGTKYNSALVVLPFLAAHIYAVLDLPPVQRLRALLGWRLWVALGALALSFLATTPFAIFDLTTFLNDLASVVAHYRTGHLGHEGDDNWLFYVRSFLGTDTLPTLFTLAGVALAFVRHRRQDVVLLSFVLPFYLSMSSYRVNFTRNMLPLLPFTSILAGLALVLLVRWGVSMLQGRRAARAVGGTRPWGSWALWLVAGLAALSVLPSTAAALQRGYRQTQPDTRVRAARWLNANTPPGTKVWLEAVGPALTPGRYITGQGDHVTEHDMAWYAGNRYEYLVLSAGAYKPVVYDNPQADPGTRDAYLRFFDENAPRLAADFESNDTDTPGPSIRIYRTTYAPPTRPEDVRAAHLSKSKFREMGGNGSTMELLGADYPTDVRAGEHLPVVLYWRAAGKPSADYTVFVHLLADSGAVPVQRDIAPRNGTSPTSLWADGQVVVDEAGLDLPANLAPGEYRLRVGMYSQQDGQPARAFELEGGTAPGGQDYVVLDDMVRVEAASP